MICWLCLGSSHGWGDCLLVERTWMVVWLVWGMVFGLEDVFLVERIDFLDREMLYWLGERVCWRGGGLFDGQRWFVFCCWL